MVGVAGESAVINGARFTVSVVWGAELSVVCDAARTCAEVQAALVSVQTALISVPGVALSKYFSAAVPLVPAVSLGMCSTSATLLPPGMKGALNTMVLV